MAPSHDRWVTFDCYGTLIDWNPGIRRELSRLLDRSSADRLVDRFHQHERIVQAKHPTLAYREVLALCLERVAEEEGHPLPQGEREGVAESVASWAPFPEVPAALRQLRKRGWRLAILSNTDRDLIEESLRVLGAPVDLTVVASEVGSYKPARRPLECFLRQDGYRPRAPCSCHSERLPRRRAGIRAGAALCLDQPLGRTARSQSDGRAPEHEWATPASRRARPRGGASVGGLT
jgi:2-haloacid dehalogenase